MVDIRANVKRVKERVAEAALRAGRDPSEITIVAVSKNFPVEAIEEAIEAGITDIGENRVQEAEAKFNRIGRVVRWHMVGHLQRNKVKKALNIFDLIHSVDSVRLLEELEKRAAQRGEVVEVLVQVNTSGEETKFGLKPEEVEGFMEIAAQKEHVRVLGLMTIGPLVDDPEKARPCFAMLREIKERVEGMKLPNVEMRHLSMGMTNDFEVAIEEGADMVRIGRAIFGPRG
ncbi:YggS family pyridoxal phosphate-dependent enzyme [Candidatus Poribacteria bacterium]|nr:MAG: YggS family pyridoxal phosphate-dependent enzyme [Candidatus Poribacteria bacterium]